MRRAKRGSRGITLIESVIALAVLATGIAAVFGMAFHVQNANRTMLLQTRSLDALARITAQIQNAQCDYDPQTPPPPGTVDPNLTDPGLTNFGTFITAPTGSITYVGLTDGSTQLEQTVPPMEISYMVTGDNATPEIPALDIEVRVKEITHDPAIDALNTGYHVRTYPVRKMCNPRLDELRRGEYR